MPLIWVVAALVVLSMLSGSDDNSDPWAWLTNPIDDVMTWLDEITRGKRLTRAKYNATGVVDADPDELASIAGTDLETYALARMISSEEGNSPNRVKAAVAWCMVNESRRRGSSISSILLRAKNPLHNGWFGTQKDIDPASANYDKSDRYASTGLDPYEGDLLIAQGVLDGTLPDETDGAQQFDRPAGEKDPARVAANRMASGAELVMVPGLDSIRFWRT